jgi:hypothetical protein
MPSDAPPAGPEQGTRSSRRQSPISRLRPLTTVRRTQRFAPDLSIARFRPLPSEKRPGADSLETRMAVSALTGCFPLAIVHPTLHTTLHTTFYAGLDWTSMNRIGHLSHIISYIQIFNGCGWTAPERSVADGVGFEPTRSYSPLPVFKTGAFNHSATHPLR